MWPGRDPIGRRLALDQPDAPVLEVVGVAKDVAPFRAGEATAPELWWSFDQMPRWGAYLIVRTQGPPPRGAAQVRERVEGEASGLQVGTFRTMTDLVHGRLVAPRFNLLLIGGFAVLAVVMAMVGLYGLVSYLVTLRQRELAIRMALGASAADVRRGVLWHGVRLALAGLAFGLVGAVAIGRLLGSLLAGVSPLDPVTFALVPLAVLGCVLVATWRPSWRASRVQPMTLLRAD
jgi:putative ABC transport system permease protein